MGSVLWVGSDRGYIESFRLVDAKGISGRVAKGCRVQADPKRSVVALSYRSSLSKVTRNPCLMVGFSGSRELRMFRVKDEFGTVEPFMSISAPSPLRYYRMGLALTFSYIFIDHSSCTYDVNTVLQCLPFGHITLVKRFHEFIFCGHTQIMYV